MNPERFLQKKRDRLARIRNHAQQIFTAGQSREDGPDSRMCISPEAAFLLAKEFDAYAETFTCDFMEDSE